MCRRYNLSRVEKNESRVNVFYRKALELDIERIASRIFLDSVPNFILASTLTTCQYKHSQRSSQGEIPRHHTWFYITRNIFTPTDLLTDLIPIIELS